MPELVTDESDWSMNSENESLESGVEHVYNNDKFTVLNCNNLIFNNSSCFTINAPKTETAPTNLDTTKTAGALNFETNNYTNGTYQDDDTIHHDSTLFDNESTIIIIRGNQNPNVPSILFSNAIYSVEDNNCILHGQINYNRDELEDVYFSDAKIIKTRNSQWYVHVPIRFENGETVKTWIFADPGANTPCVKTEWALKHFPNMIAKNKILRVMLTPGGPIKPEYSLWMVFPANENTALKVKMNLVNDLPVDILADINTLGAFGYIFKDETPPIFRHDEKPDLELELKTDDEFLSNRKDPNWFNCVTQQKLKQLESTELQGDDSNKINLVDKIYDGNGELICNNCKVEMKNDLEARINEVRLAFDKGDKSNDNNNTIIEIERIDNEDRIEIDCSKFNINNITSNMNEGKENCKIYKKCLFLTSKESYLATKDEIEKAKKLRSNKKLSFPDYSYLKTYEKKYGKKYFNLYNRVMEWKEKYIKIFATHTYSRKTMYTTPARLGIKPEHRDKIMYCPQYPISAEKRIHMINYTLINEKNGFWYKIPRSKHGMPYLCVPKKNSKGVILRYRPAFDARIVNQYCELMQIVMPTRKDFRNLHQRPGLTTLADIKNFFDCIPLHWKDQKYAVCFTPMGIYCMLCLTYGFMNAAPEAQKRTNELALYVTNTLVYVDDIQIKHLLEEGTEGVIEGLTRLGDYCIKKNIQLSPTKFYPATDESESFGFRNTMIGQLVSESYKRKLLAFAKPKTKAEMRSFDGLCNYVNNHIYHNKRIFYWLNRLKEKVDPETKRKRLVWDREANLAWEQLQYLFNNLPLLHHPNREGMFCLKVDACNYGVGAELYQDQSGEGQEPDWKLIDLWSKVMPTQLRHCHSMVHEAYSVASAFEHWQFYLIRAKFILCTDNMAVANIFGEYWKDLCIITQKQLLRIRSRLSCFNFVSHHVAGLKNELADGLSRFTVELIKTNKNLTDNKFPLELRVIESDDTMTPTLTGKELKDFKLIQKECEILTDKYNELKNKKIELFVNHISDSKYGELYQWNDIINSKSNKLNIDKYKSQLHEMDKSFDSMIHEYQNNGNYLQRKDLKQFIELEKINLIRQGDDVMLQSEIDMMKETMINNLECLNEILDDECVKLNDVLEQEYWQHLNEMKIIDDMLHVDYINAIDKPYQPSDERRIKLESKRKSTIVTRSVTKRLKEKERNETMDDDTIEQERKFSRINTRFDNIRDQMESHEDFMLKMFGRRKYLDVLDFSKYREYQESDNILALVIKLFKQPDKSKWSSDDMNTIWESDKWLFDKLQFGALRIEDNILKCRDIHPVTKERVIKIIVPFHLRGKLMDYAHHNVLHHHMSEKYTYRKLASKFWWSTLYKDVKAFCKACVSCQFVNGGPKKRAALMERYRPLPRQHIFADILGPIYQRYYVLVLVDYATGYSMLIPMEGCDAISIAYAIFEYWIRIFGCFEYLETDWGSGFTSKLFKYISKLLNFEHEIAEPRNHRSIGKVERVIGFLQAVINHYNLLLDGELTDFEDANAAWTRIKILLPFIQFGFNQRVMRITGISPNMAIFGTNLNDLTDVARMTARIEEFSKDKSLNRRDFELLNQLKENIENMNKIADSNWKDVTKLSVKSYNNKYNITPESINRNRDKFEIGNEVLYFIGDKQTARYKWKEKWSGPWILEKKLNDSTMIISDPRNGNQKRVSIDRLKIFTRENYIDYNSFVENNREYLDYQNELIKMMSNYQVRMPNQEWNLDYTRFNNSKISIDIDKIKQEKENESETNESNV